MKGHIQNCLMNYTAIYNFATMISLCRHLYCIGEKRSLTMKHHNSNVFDHLLPNPNLQHKKTVGLVLIPLLWMAWFPALQMAFVHIMAICLVLIPVSICSVLSLVCSLNMGTCSVVKNWQWNKTHRAPAKL